MNTSERRELNVRMAEFMGWVQAYDSMEDKYFWMDGKSTYTPENTSFIYYVDEWQPSTDIKHAWLVVEKLIEMGYYVDIGVWKHGAVVQLKMVPTIGGRDAPEAICLAAVAVVDAGR
jgi:hypothetical protein